jgi:hypothetical protein
MRKEDKRRAPEGTTRSPADRDIFRDDGPKTPVKELPPEAQEKLRKSSEAGGVD